MVEIFSSGELCPGLSSLESDGRTSRWLYPGHTRSEADQCALGFVLLKHGHLARALKPCGVCKPCLEPAGWDGRGTRLGWEGDKAGCTSLTLLYFSARHDTDMSLSPKRGRLIHVCFNHCCLSWISLVCRVSTEQQNVFLPFTSVGCGSEAKHSESLLFASIVVI